MAKLWWAQTAPFCLGYLFFAPSPLLERVMLAYLAFVSIAAMAETENAKAAAAEARDKENE
jgi:hypothetical protein